MKKFLSIPVTSEGSYLIGLENIALIEQASTTTVTISYTSNSAGTDVLTITHDALSAGSEAMRDRIQDSIISAYKTAWTEPKYDVDFGGIAPAAGGLMTVTGIAIA